MSSPQPKKNPGGNIPGTKMFDGGLAEKGFAINAMCFSFNQASNREAFKANPEAFMEKFKLTKQQRNAIRNKDVLDMINAGGNVYYLAKLAGIWGLNVQDLGAAQTGVSVEEFKQKLLDKAEQIGEPKWEI